MVSKTKKIKELYNKIEKLTKIKSTLRSKLLCDNQIAEEAKRRKEENLSIGETRIVPSPPGFFW